MSAVIHVIKLKMVAYYFSSATVLTTAIWRAQPQRYNRRRISTCIIQYQILCTYNRYRIVYTLWIEKRARERQRRGKGRRLNAAIAIITAVREKKEKFRSSNIQILRFLFVQHVQSLTILHARLYFYATNNIFFFLGYYSMGFIIHTQVALDGRIKRAFRSALVATSASSPSTTTSTTSLEDPSSSHQSKSQQQQPQQQRCAQVRSLALIYYSRR